MLSIVLGVATQIYGEWMNGGSRAREKGQGGGQGRERERENYQIENLQMKTAMQTMTQSRV